MISRATASRIVLDRPQIRERTALRVEQWGARFATIAGLIGFSVLVGYVTRTAWVVKLSGRLPPMYPNAALGLICGSVAILGSRRSGLWRIAAAVGVVGLAVIGGVSLELHLRGAERTWFEGLFPGNFVPATTLVGGRPAPETCLAFVLLAGALTSLVLRRVPWLGQALAVAGASVGLSAVVGYVFGVDRSALRGDFVYVGMALHTGIGISLLGAASVCARPSVGFAAPLLDGGIAGGLARRAVVVVGIAPAVLIIAGVALGHLLPTEALSESVFSVLQVSVLSISVLIPSAVIVRTERHLRDVLDNARRAGEHRGEVEMLVEAVTAEMTVTVPELPGWQVAMRYRPATGHLAGDSVHVHVRQEPRTATLLALIDVAGHDVYSAVVAYGLRAHIGALWESGADLNTVVSSTNAKVIRRNTIATAVFVVVEPGVDSVEMVNAGHPAPVHVRSGQQTLWSRTGPLFGLPNAMYDVRVCEILPGDLIVFYTDGVSEARSPDGHELGDEFIYRLIAVRQTETVIAIAAACTDAAVEHAQSRLRDDVLVIAARR